jgi:hypothetical protein
MDLALLGLTPSMTGSHKNSPGAAFLNIHEIAMGNIKRRVRMTARVILALCALFNGAFPGSLN